MKLKITSDGTSLGTKLVDEDSGETIGLVQKIEWSIGVDSAFATCTVKLAKMPLEASFVNTKFEYDVDLTEEK